jgi:predicted pyridoxine 5'-phosphate oxidase superfamily flavin-nucleotide-binding protein
MADHFLKTLMTPAALAAQKTYYGAAQTSPESEGVDRLGADEREFIEARDSFYMASVSPDGWPYIQHRGGPRGFLRVQEANRIAFADLRGNRQLLTTGNLSADHRVALFLMDYPNRTRLKLLGRATVLDARKHLELARTLVPATLAGRVERIFVIEVESFDWNCPQYITPRFTAEELEPVVAPLRQRIAELEQALQQARAAVPGALLKP